MNRIINNPDLVVEDMLRGYLRVHGDLVSGTDNPRVVRAVRAPIRGKVGVVTGGGSGHEPAFLGYVGNHLVDAVAIGEIFSSPTANSFYDAFKAAMDGRPGFVIAPWCGSADCEAQVKIETQATIRNMPLNSATPTDTATLTATPQTYMKTGASVVCGVAGTCYLMYGKKMGDVGKMIIGAALTLASFFFF